MPPRAKVSTTTQTRRRQIRSTIVTLTRSRRCWIAHPHASDVCLGNVLLIDVELASRLLSALLHQHMHPLSSHTSSAFETLAHMSTATGSAMAKNRMSCRRRSRVVAFAPSPYTYHVFRPLLFPSHHTLRSWFRVHDYQYDTNITMAAVPFDTESEGSKFRCNSNQHTLDPYRSANLRLRGLSVHLLNANGPKYSHDYLLPERD